MKEQILKIIIATVFIVYLQSCNIIHVETKKLYNSVSDEKIYLKYYEWGLGHEGNVISLNRKANLSDPYSDYVIQTGAYLYKLQSDTLFLYGTWDISELNIDKGFKTKVVFKIVYNNEFIDLYKTRESEGLSLFPPSFSKFVKNN